ncbi:MAG TPA: hypothetical protein PLR06_07545 [Cyclobacteriaceae bacterium]|nr:hypothetical protein [Cyclobacteriaceae bacterium]
MKFKFSSLILSLLTCLAIWSCGPKPKSEDDKNKDFDNASKKSLNAEIKGIGDNLPPPSEIPYILMASGAEFNQSLVNDRRKASTYESQGDKAALNLGVYSADIGYLSAYDKTQESIDYLNTSKSLADKLGISASFDQAILKRFESNIGNKDSLASILDQTVKTMDKYLVEDNRSKLAALMVAGSFVESLYLSTAIIKSYPPNILPTDKRNNILTPLIQLVIKQKASVSEVTKMLSGVDQSGAIPGIISDLKNLEASYAALKLDEAIKTNKSNLTLTPETIASITKVVEKLRGDLVQ